MSTVAAHVGTIVCFHCWFIEMTQLMYIWLLLKSHKYNINCIVGDREGNDGEHQNYVTCCDCGLSRYQDPVSLRSFSSDNKRDIILPLVLVLHLFSLLCLSASLPPHPHPVCLSRPPTHHPVCLSAPPPTARLSLLPAYLSPALRARLPVSSSPPSCSCLTLWLLSQYDSPLMKAR